MLEQDAQLAGIEYHGQSGASKDCLASAIVILQFGREVTRCRILTAGHTHALLLTVDDGDLIAVKSGFSSGYGGTGPNAFSLVLEVFDTFGVQLEEYEVDKAVLRRLDDSALLNADVERLEPPRSVRPSRWPEYVFERHSDGLTNARLWKAFPLAIPFAIVDLRLMDVAISFWSAPNEKLMSAYRRLEDIVRERIDSGEHGHRLFSRAFLGTEARLVWPGLDAGEQTGRAQLFTSTFMAHRNRRAHRELPTDNSLALREFLLVNHLFLLESEARDKASD